MKTQEELLMDNHFLKEFRMGFRRLCGDKNTFSIKTKGKIGRVWIQVCLWLWQG